MIPTVNYTVIAYLNHQRRKWPRRIGMTVWGTIANSWHWITGSIAAIDGLLLVLIIPWILSLKKEATSAVAWCLLVVFLPVFGALLFVMFGYQSIQRPLKLKLKHRRRYREQSAKAPAIESKS